ncbi:MAG: hypothetical protein ABIK28_09090 [Planctomycetota bacterium]
MDLNVTPPVPESRQKILAILGGSSAFTPALAHALAQAARSLPALEIRLHGRNRERLACVARFCNRYARTRSIPHEYSFSTSVREVAEGAMIIINQMRVGGWAGRTRDERFPLAFGLPGDETIGPGGLASAIRAVPIVLAAAERVAEVAPGAWFINMGNPMGILLAGLSALPGIRPLGLCELPAKTLAKACSLIGCDSEAVEADYLGCNHQGWFVRLAQGQKDLLPTLFDRIDSSCSADFFKVDTTVMREVNALPLPYMRLYYHTARETQKLIGRIESRGQELDDLSTHLYEWYGDSANDSLPDLISKRNLDWFELALVPALIALLGGGKRVLYVSEKNGHDIPGMPAHAIVEKQSMLHPGGTSMIPFKGPQPSKAGAYEPFLQFLRDIAAFEEAALEAALQPNVEKVRKALSLHPMGIDKAKAIEMVPHVLQSIKEAPVPQEGEKRSNDQL